MNDLVKNRIQEAITHCLFDVLLATGSSVLIYAVKFVSRCRHAVDQPFRFKTLNHIYHRPDGIVMGIVEIIRHGRAGFHDGDT